METDTVKLGRASALATEGYPLTRITIDTCSQTRSDRTRTYFTTELCHGHGACYGGWIVIE